MSIARKAVKGSFWVAGTDYSTFIVGFASQLVLVRLLFPKEFGIYALAFSLLELISVFFAWSFSLGLIQAQEGKHLKETAYILSLAQGLALLLVLSLASLVVGRLHSSELAKVFFILGLGRPLNFVANIYSAGLEKELEYTGLSIARFAVGITSAVGAVGLAYAGFGVWSLVGRDLLRTGGYFAGYRLVSPWRFRWRFDGDSARKLLKFGWGMLFARGFEAAYYRLDNILVGTVLGIVSLGYYSQARYLVGLANPAVAPATTMVAYSTFSKLRHNKANLSHAYQITNYFLVRLLLPASFIFFLFPEPIVLLLYGEKWKPVAPLLKVLGLYVVLSPVFENVKVLLYSLGRLGQAAIVRLVQLSILIPSLLVGTAWMEARGAALAFILSLVAGVILIYIFTKEYTFSSLVKNYKAPFLSGTFSYLLNVIFLVPSASVAFSVMLFLSFYVLGLMMLEGKELLEQTFLLFGKKLRFTAR